MSPYRYCASREIWRRVAYMRDPTADRWSENPALAFSWSPWRTNSREWKASYLAGIIIVIGVLITAEGTRRGTERFQYALVSRFCRTLMALARWPARWAQRPSMIAIFHAFSCVFARRVRPPPHRRGRTGIHALRRSIRQSRTVRGIIVKTCGSATQRGGGTARRLGLGLP